MVVDADLLSRMAVADYLRHCGYRVIEGSSADDVDAVLYSHRHVDIMLIDLTLDDSQDGFALAQRVRSSHPVIEVILTSSPARLAEKAGDLCDDGPLVKPYDPKELERRIVSLRERRQRDMGSARCQPD